MDHVPQYGQKTRNFGLGSPKGRGFLFWRGSFKRSVLNICVEAESAGSRVKKHNSALVKVRYSRGDRGTGEVPMFAHIRAEILFLAAGAILVVGVAYLF